MAALAGEGGPPDPFLMLDGRRVDSVEMWRTARRPEIIELFQRQVFGRPPPIRLDEMEVLVAATDLHALDDNAIRQDVTITLGGPGGKAAMHLLVFLPKSSAQPAPCFLHIMHRARPPFDTVDLTSSYWPVRQIVGRGYATVLYAPTELDPDRPDGYAEGIRPIFAASPVRAPDAWGTIAAWAWGASRVLDYLSTNPGIDARRIAIIGHSRSGKAALWAGALDERFALVISNNSGCTGAALSRGKRGERIADINREFPHWFCENYRSYGGREEALPLDQHLLLAAIAPRPLAVASATEDGWADPASEYRSCVLASPVYALHGMRGVDDVSFPPEKGILNAGRISYHLRRGRHGLTAYDWDCYLNFADRELRSP